MYVAAIGAFQQRSSLGRVINEEIIAWKQPSARRPMGKALQHPAAYATNPSTTIPLRPG
jgi:hypothetical protein